MTKTVRRLHTDMQHLRKAEANLKKHTGAEKKAVTAQKTDSAAEKKALAALQTQEKAVMQQVMDAYDSTTPPDESAVQALLGQLVALGEKSVKAQQSFQTRLAKDAKLVKNEKAAMAKDKKAIHADRKKALKDLKPAEYEMSLRDTNRVRRELGLKKVDHVIRAPGSKASKAVDLAKKYLGRYESDLQRHGITQPCPLNESCANFVTSMLSKSGAINFKTLRVSELNTMLRARGWHVVPLSKAQPGDVWICNGAHGESHTELVASNRGGHVTLIGSNNHPNPSNQQINYDDRSPHISGSFILAPPR